MLGLTPEQRSMLPVPTPFEMAGHLPKLPVPRNFAPAPREIIPDAQTLISGGKELAMAAIPPPRAAIKGALAVAGLDYPEQVRTVGIGSIPPAVFAGGVAIGAGIVISAIILVTFMETKI